MAYLTNLYPHVVLTFVRREIAALESRGIRVERFALRRLDEDSFSEQVEAERGRTRAALEAGVAGLAWSVLSTSLTRPIKFAKAAILAWRIGLRSDRGLLIHAAYLAEACVLRGWFSACGARHVHAHFGTNSAAVAMLAHELGGPPYSFTVHGPDEFDVPSRIALDEKIRRAEFVVAVSHYGQGQLYRWVDSALWPKIHVVRCGVDASFSAVPLEPIPEAPRLVCVGRIAVQKGHLLLVQAAARLAAEGVEFELTLVGDGPQRAEVDRLIDRLGLSGRVKITGFVGSEEVRREILRSRALVLASLAEGLPVVIMEALALGRPVVATSIAGIPELVQPGVNGWLVPSGSVDALAEAIRAVLSAPAETLERMGRAGAARVAEFHDSAVEGERLARLIDRSLEAHGAVRERTSRSVVEDGARAVADCDR